jgi:hypothetical protein
MTLHDMERDTKASMKEENSYTGTWFHLSVRNPTYLPVGLTLFLVCSNGHGSKEKAMDSAKQRELIRLWNELRKAQGPAAEEIRIQILAQFERPQSRAA